MDQKYQPCQKYQPGQMNQLDKTKYNYFFPPNVNKGNFEYGYLLPPENWFKPPPIPPICPVFVSQSNQTPNEYK